MSESFKKRYASHAKDQGYILSNNTSRLVLEPHKKMRAIFLMASDPARAQIARSRPAPGDSRVEGGTGFGVYCCYGWHFFHLPLSRSIPCRFRGKTIQRLHDVFNTTTVNTASTYTTRHILSHRYRRSTNWHKPCSATGPGC